MKKNIYFYTNLLAWTLVFFLVGNYVFGWTTPTQNPPEGDLSAPLDMSSTEQTKTGNLIIGSLLKIGRYSSAPTGSTGALYYDTTENEFKGYKASSWDSLGGGEDTDTWITTNCLTSTEVASADIAYDVSCTNCLTNVEVASADVASDLSCTDCIGTTEIADSYVLNTGDAMTGALAMGNNKITGLATPTADTDAATKAYVDASAGGGPSMYMTASTRQGNHNCDDVPSTCCATGYHMCRSLEMYGRTLEVTGTDRRGRSSALTYLADFDNGNGSSMDCIGWTSASTSSDHYRNKKRADMTGTCSSAQCDNVAPQWCCTD